MSWQLITTLERNITIDCWGPHDILGRLQRILGKTRCQCIAHRENNSLRPNHRVNEVGIANLWPAAGIAALLSLPIVNLPSWHASGPSSSSSSRLRSFSMCPLTQVVAVCPSEVDMPSYPCVPSDATWRVSGMAAEGLRRRHHAALTASTTRQLDDTTTNVGLRSLLYVS